MSNKHNSIEKLIDGYFPGGVIRNIKEFAGVQAPDSYKTDAASRGAAIQVARYNVLQTMRAALAHKDWKTITSCLPVLLQECRSDPRVLFGAVVDALHALCDESPLARVDREAAAEQRARLLRLFRLVIQSDRFSLGRTEASVAIRLDSFSHNPSHADLLGVSTDGDGAWAVAHMEKTVQQEAKGSKTDDRGSRKRSQSHQLRFAGILARVRHFTASLVQELLEQQLFEEAIAVCEDSMRTDPPRGMQGEGKGRRRARGTHQRPSSSLEGEGEREDWGGDGDGDGDGQAEGNGEEDEDADQLARLLGTSAAQKADKKSNPTGKKRKRVQWQEATAEDGVAGGAPAHEEGQGQGTATQGGGGEQDNAQLSLWHIRMLSMLAHAQLQRADASTHALPGTSDASLGLAQQAALRVSAEAHLRAVYDAVLDRLKGTGQAPVMQRIVALGAGAVVAPTAAEREATEVAAQQGSVLTALRAWPHVTTAGDSLARLLADTGKGEEARVIRQKWIATVHGGRSA